MMLFLGAGASKPFGIKTMKEMSEEFENSTDLTKDERELYLDIKNTLGSDNLEDILTVLNDLTKSSPDPSIRYFNSKLDFFFDEFNKTLIELSGLLRELERKKVAIVGVGDAGLNTIDQLQGIKIEDSEIIAINTDSEHLNLIRGADKKKLIGESLTRGLGAHGSPEIGEKVALLSEDIIKEALVSRQAYNDARNITHAFHNKSWMIEYEKIYRDTCQR
uniref:Cell division protein FtsZ n=1 Tax=Candidatus Methanophaga sp. ANME-1 ERB7 TaxID=2759913 RepID=A0A7G9Z874_9EURY|nr:cell division protein FtsZ [Methanosarcinales archaeon ANME-1 ERB7]